MDSHESQSGYTRQAFERVAAHDRANAYVDDAAAPHLPSAAASTDRRLRVFALEARLLRSLTPRRQRANLIAASEGISASHVRKLLAER